MAALLAVDRYVTDWLDLLTRWLHVIAGILWIGSSVFFLALDNHLRPPKDETEREIGIGGETWEIHGGGFYNIKKYLVAPRVLPETLHWFKWEAYTTWLSGFALMIVLYYLHADTYLIDKSVADLSTGEAVAISVGLLAAAWLAYDALCRLLGSRPFVLAAALLGMITLAAWGSSHLCSGRATYLQVGAMIGTMMVGNVFFVIIPAHWELVRAKEAGRDPDPAANARGKLRSVHNNYLTLPVVFAMISNHFPFTYGHRHSWLILVALMAIGAWVRHYFNLRHGGVNAWWIPATAVVGVVVLVPRGQDTALTIRNTLLGGRGGGVRTALGVAAGQAVWVLASSAGLAALLVASEPAFVALRVAGAAYLVWLGARSLWSA